jgi:hypothetical protein
MNEKPWWAEQDSDEQWIAEQVRRYEEERWIAEQVRRYEEERWESEQDARRWAAVPEERELDSKILLGQT